MNKIPDIKLLNAVLAIRGWSISQLATYAGFKSVYYLHNAVLGKVRLSPKMEQGICKAIGQEHWDFATGKANVLNRVNNGV